MFTIAYPVFLLLIPLVMAAAWWRWYYYKKPVYRFSSMLPLAGIKKQTTKFVETLFFCLRLLSLLVLLSALVRPQKPDELTKIPVEGIDIMLVLDVSGSMLFFDDLKDTRTRIEVACSEALQFIQHRENDPIGIVLFANEILSRCPLTLDKLLLKEFIQEIHVGMLEPNGTMLARGIISAASRLKQSAAKSKIMIVLTDGEPTPGDFAIISAIELAKKIGVKIYTIAIGSRQGSYRYDRFNRIVQFHTVYNTDLLKKIAEQTGGQFFEAQKPQELALIYKTIDSLEKTSITMPLFARSLELFVPLLWLVLLLVCAEIAASSLVWLSL